MLMKQSQPLPLWGKLQQLLFIALKSPLNIHHHSVPPKVYTFWVNLEGMYTIVQERKGVPAGIQESRQIYPCMSAHHRVSHMRSFIAAVL